MSMTCFKDFESTRRTGVSLNTCSHTRLWSMMQNMNMSCRMMWAGFLRLKVTCVTGVSLSNHRECSPCFCSFRLHSVYSFCTREYSKIWKTNRHTVTGKLNRWGQFRQNVLQCLPAGQHAPRLSCWLLGGWLWLWDRSCIWELYNAAANIQSHK